MKRYLLLLVVAVLAVGGCNSSGDVEDDGGRTVIDFETDLGEAQCIYNNDDSSNSNSMTVPTPSEGTRGESDGNEGEKTLKIIGELQPDRYAPHATEAGLRLKIADFLGKGPLPLVDKVFYIKVRIEEGSLVESIQVNFQDSDYQQAMGNGQKVKPETEIENGWNILYYKLVGPDSSERVKYADTLTAELLSVDADGNKLEESPQGAYSSETFNIDDITEIEIRLLDGINNESENTEQNIGETVVAYIDEIGWYVPGQSAD
jgi:hypothetical protein